MKICLSLLGLSVITLAAGEIRATALSFSEENELRVSRNEPLTVVMPFVLRQGAIVGGAITSNPEQLAPFYIRVSDGTPTFNLRALKEVGETTINVLSPDNEVAVLRLVVDERTNDSVVNFQTKSVVPVAEGVGSYHPKNISAYLERTFLYPLLKKADSELIVASEEFGFENVSTKFPKGVTLDLESAVRWTDPHPRLVVFNATLNNPSNEEVFYDRHSFEVLVGDNRYRPAVSHSSGVIQAGETHPIQLSLSENDYADITKIDLHKNQISFALSFEPGRSNPDNILSEHSLLPSFEGSK